MLTSNIRKTVLAVAALALCPTLAFAQAGTDTAKPMTATTMSTPMAAPAAGAKVVKTVKAHKTTKVSHLARHHKKMAQSKMKSAKTAAVSTAGTMKARTAAK
jgi:hypothetical protein